MAGYSFLSAEQTIQVLSDDITRPAQRVTGIANASGVVYSLLFAPYPTDEQGSVIWTADAINGQMDYWAGVWDQNAQVPGVLDISVTQNVNPAGRLMDVAVVVVASTSGKSTTQIELGPREWAPSVAGTTLTRSFPDAVAQARAQLDAVEAGSG